MSAADLYLDLLKRALTRIAFEDESVASDGDVPRPMVVGERESGSDWPIHAETMIGMKRLDQLQAAVETVIHEGIPGDLIETGVWRGGASILMRGVLAAYGDRRNVWLADSFQGLPKPDPATFPADEGDVLWTQDHLAVPLWQVQANFARYGLLDEQVRFLPGWFRDTLPAAPPERLAVLRLDGDLYESTWIALTSLLPKLSPGGFVIVDDYSLVTCRAAVDDFRARHGIEQPLVEIDWTGVYWRSKRR